MAPIKCSYFMCNSASDQTSMFRFPTGNPARLEAWLSNCDSNFSYRTGLQDPLSTEPVITDLQLLQDNLTKKNSDKCRFCGKITEDCIDATGKPYVEKNKTALTLNSLSVQFDFDNDVPKVCLDCDKKLQEIFDFVKLVKAAQDSFIKVDGAEETETLVIKIESESPTPDDNDETENEDTKEGIVDSITIGETVFVKNYINKRKFDETDATKRKKKPKVVKDTITEVASEELIIDIKEEATEMDDDANDVHKRAYSEISETETNGNDKPSELDIATHVLLDDMVGDGTFS